MEDSHYYLKNIGLESYIGHEKTFCDPLPREEMENLDFDPLSSSKIKAEEHGKDSEGVKDACEKQEIISEVVNQITGNIQADDFFSSLELQSSSKTSSNLINLNFSNKPPGGIVTRSRSFTSTLHEPLKPPAKMASNLKMKGTSKKSAGKKKVGKLKRMCDKGRRIKTKRKTKKSLGAKRSSSEGKDKVFITETKKQISSKLDENILDKSLILEKSKEEDDWILFNNLGLKKETDYKVMGNDLQVRRCTPELFSINSILMSDAMSEGKDEVDKLLDVDDYDDGFLEEMEEFTYAPPRSHTGGKWKPGSLSIRTSPMLWQNQTWESLLDDRNQEEEGKSRSETPVESPTDSSGDRTGKFFSVPSTGGKWKLVTPPATYTGEKLKPLTPPATSTEGKWKSLTSFASCSGTNWKASDFSHRSKKSSQEIPSPDDSEHNWKCEGQAEAGPPSSHTGGKWKPNSSLSHETQKWKPELNSSKMKPGVPPTNHTRGKWVSEAENNSVNRSTLDVLANCQSTPGKCLKTSGGMIQYYCSPCNRRLSSKKMYKKHVESELHFKRVLQENELEFDSRSLKLFHGLFTQAGCTERGLGKRIVKKPDMFKDSELGISLRDRKLVNSVKIKRKIARREIRCEVCKIKLLNHQLGKHLVSYYHSRRIQLSDLNQQKLILDNIHAIVKQAPYQCGICKFYCNTHTLFKKHWLLDVHRDLEQMRNQRFWCSLCSFECTTSRSMELHLDSNSHREVILAVNKSIPIIIRHKFIFECSICFKEFRFNRELNRHKEIFHKLTDPDRSNKFVCSGCSLNCKSMKSLQRHILNCQKSDGKVPYFCSVCNEFFNTAAEAKTHRNGVLHKYKKNMTEGKVSKKSLSRTCFYCPEILEDLEKLKSHLYKNHPEFLPKCIKCGMIFALSQEVSQHVKNNDCKFTEKRHELSFQSFNCDVCSFFTDSKAEFLLHTAIHQKNKEERKIACPLCGQMFMQVALSNHLKTHLKEMTYQCSMCTKAFVRKDRYVSHLRSKHFIKKDANQLVVGNAGVKEEETLKEKKIRKAKEEEEEEDLKNKMGIQSKEKKCEKLTGKKRQICGDPKCKYIAKDINDLENHNLIHIGPKMYQCPDCPYYAKTNTIIKRHYMIHVDERSFPCPHCSFRARLKSHLNRHLRLHTGAKPYKCPHCTYSCNILENLRKHVLFTKLHPGKKLYECKLCNFDTNVSKDFKTHLSTNHKDDYRLTETNIAAGIYSREEDSGNVINPLPRKPKSSSTQPSKKPESFALKKKMDLITQKLTPLAPKLSYEDKKTEASCQNLKKAGNTVEDKRKILEMELQKLRKQIKPDVKKLPRSYPSPAEKDLKMKMAERMGKKSDAVDGKKVQKETPSKENQSNASGQQSDVLLLNISPSLISVAEETPAKVTKANDMGVQQVELSPAYILYENVLPIEETELYLLEDYQV